MHDDEINGELDSKVQEIVGGDGRYREEAYRFVLRAVESTLSEIAEVRHISGAELCEGLRKLAVQQFGPMAKEVLNYWGICSTGDFGVIVFHLVDAGLLLKTERDRMEDFLGVYDFDEAFERDYYRP
jgi:uncharacterized repeat protein (TIGR04138 family)